MSKAPQNGSFAGSFMHLELRRECKVDYRSVGGSKPGTEGQDYVPSYVLEGYSGISEVC